MRLTVPNAKQNDEPTILLCLNKGPGPDGALCQRHSGTVVKTVEGFGVFCLYYSSKQTVKKRKNSFIVQ